jgi:hypothetical protein
MPDVLHVASFYPQKTRHSMGDSFRHVTNRLQMWSYVKRAGSVSAKETEDVSPPQQLEGQDLQPTGSCCTLRR